MKTLQWIMSLYLHHMVMSYDDDDNDTVGDESYNPFIEGNR